MSSTPVSRGKRWQIQVCVAGKRKSKTFDTKKEAVLWAAQEEDYLKDGTDPLASSRTMLDVFNRYAREVSPHKAGARWETIRLKSFEKHSLSKIKLSDLRPHHIAAWRDNRLKEVSPSSVAREITIIKHSLEIARKEWNWLDVNPSKDIAKPKSAPARERRISQWEIEQLMVAMGFSGEVETKMHEAAVAFLLGIETAMRASEILRISPDTVKNDVMHLPMTKNGESRKVPLSPEAMRLIRLLPDERFSINAASLDALFRKARSRTIIENLHFHDSRHEGTTRLAEKFHVLDLARITGHKDLKQLMKYYNMSAEDLAEQMRS